MATLATLIILLLSGCKRPASEEKPDGAEASTAAQKTRLADASKAPASSKSTRVGVLYWSMNIPGQVAMRRGLESALVTTNAAREAKGASPIELIVRVAGDGDKGIERQIDQMGELIAQRVDLIIAQPTDNAALSKRLQEANRAGIPVITYDQHILNGDVTSFITSNNYQAGYLDGEYVAAKFPDTQTLGVILVEYPNVSSTVSRVNGFADALEKSGQPFKVLKTYNAVEPIGGRAAGEAMLRDFPEKHSVDVVFTVNDGGGLAVFDALSKAGRDEIFGATVDGDPKSVEIIRGGGIIKIDSAQFCGEIGATALRTADAFLRGKEVAQSLLVPVFPITAETHHYYEGWLGQPPKPFEKPWASHTKTWSPEVVAGPESHEKE